MFLLFFLGFLDGFSGISRGRAPFVRKAHPAGWREGGEWGRRRPSPAASGVVRERPRKSVLNQNLQYLVFKCLLRTKDSGSHAAMQGVFHAQSGPSKRTGKTGGCEYPDGISTVNSRLIHQVVHDSRRRRTVAARCAFATPAQFVRCGAEPAANRLRTAPEVGNRTAARPPRSVSPVHGLPFDQN